MIVNKKNPKEPDISEEEAEQLKADLSKARLSGPKNEAEAMQEEKTTKAMGKLASEGAKMAAASVGAVDPLSQKAAAIAGKIAGEKLYKKRRTIIIVSICSILLIFFLVIYVPIAFAWFTYCESGIITKGLSQLFGFKFPCP